MLPSWGIKNVFMTLDDRKREMQRHARRHDQLVDAGHTFLRVDEQPLPVEGNDLHVERRRFRSRGCAGSSTCEPIQATPPSSRITMTGIAHTTISMRPGVGHPANSARACWKARYHHGERHSRNNVGTTMTSMMASESIRSVRSARPTGPRVRARHYHMRSKPVGKLASESERRKIRKHCRRRA